MEKDVSTTEDLLTQQRRQVRAENQRLRRQAQTAEEVEERRRKDAERKRAKRAADKRTTSSTVTATNRHTVVSNPTIAGASNRQHSRDIDNGYSFPPSVSFVKFEFLQQCSPYTF